MPQENVKTTEDTANKKSDEWFKSHAPVSMPPQNSNDTGNNLLSTGVKGPGRSGTANKKSDEWFRANAPRNRGRGGTAGSTPEGSEGGKGSFWEEAGNAALSALPLAGSVAAAAVAPEGVLAAMAFAGMGGMAGKAAQEAIKPDVGSTPELLESLGTEGLIDATGEGIGRGVNWVAGRTLAKKLDPVNMFASAIKPTSGMARRPLTRAQVEALAKTAADKGITAGEKGYAKLTGMIDANLDQADKLVREFMASGRPYKPLTRQEVVQELADVYKEFADPQTNAFSQTNKQLIDDVKKEFFGGTKRGAPVPNPAAQFDPTAPVTKPGPIIREKNRILPLDNAVEMKSNLYRDLPGKYGKQQDAQIESEKALARGLLKGLTKRIPELGALGMDTVDMIRLQEQMVKFLARERNKNILGLIPAALVGGGGIGGAVAGHETMGLTVMGLGLAKAAAVLLDNPEIKTTLANMIHKGSQTVAGRMARATAPYIAPTMFKAIPGAVNATMEDKQDK